jgi:uncharacterized protein YhfF
MESAVLEFWRNYLDSLPPDLDQEPKPSGVFSFGDSKKLAALVRQGIKTATCSALMGYEKDQVLLPQKGDLSIVLDGNGNPVLVIETVSVVILPFNEVSEQFAFEEGEGNRSLAYWRMAHENYFAVITSRIGRSARQCRLFANGSRLSAQSIDARVASRLRGMAARTESRAKRVPTLVDRFLGRFNQGRMQKRLSASPLVSRKLHAGDTRADAYRSFFVVLSPSETPVDLGHCV